MRAGHEALKTLPDFPEGVAETDSLVWRFSERFERAASIYPSTFTFADYLEFSALVGGSEPEAKRPKLNRWEEESSNIFPSPTMGSDVSEEDLVLDDDEDENAAPNLATEKPEAALSQAPKALISEKTLTSEQTFSVESPLAALSSSKDTLKEAAEAPKAMNEPESPRATPISLTPDAEKSPSRRTKEPSAKARAKSASALTPPETRTASPLGSLPATSNSALWPSTSGTSSPLPPPPTAHTSSVHGPEYCTLSMDEQLEYNRLAGLLRQKVRVKIYCAFSSSRRFT